MVHVMFYASTRASMIIVRLLRCFDVENADNWLAKMQIASVMSV